MQKSILHDLLFPELTRHTNNIFVRLHGDKRACERPRAREDTFHEFIENILKVCILLVA